MGTKAKGPFWLDGMTDRDVAEACPHHPRHQWWTFALGEVIEEPRVREPEELMTICRVCYVPRCGTVQDENGVEGRCMYARHHTEDHIYEKSRRMEPVGGKA